MFALRNCTLNQHIGALFLLMDTPLYTLNYKEKAMEEKTESNESVYVIAYRALLIARIAEDPKTWFHITPKHTPQAVPDWVTETETYKLALQAKYIQEVDPPTSSSIVIVPEHFGQPLAAETRKRPLGEPTGMVSTL